MYTTLLSTGASPIEKHLGRTAAQWDDSGGEPNNGPEERLVPPMEYDSKRYEEEVGVGGEVRGMWSGLEMDTVRALGSPVAAAHAAVAALLAGWCLLLCSTSCW